MIYGRTAAGRFELCPDADGDTWDLEWPVFMVDWWGAAAYARWAAARSGRQWRLPAEPEWEKAARGVDGRLYPWGDALDHSRCNMRGSRPGRPLPAVVDSFPVDESPYGVRGMGGNARVWCADLYDASAGRGEDAPRVLRGGAWSASPRYTRVANRARNAPSARYHFLSVRLFRSLP